MSDKDIDIYEIIALAEWERDVFHLSALTKDDLLKLVQKLCNELDQVTRAKASIEWSLSSEKEKSWATHKHLRKVGRLVDRWNEGFKADKAMTLLEELLRKGVGNGY